MVLINQQMTILTKMTILKGIKLNFKEESDNYKFY